jgi:hypothetical protein
LAPVRLDYHFGWLGLVSITLGVLLGAFSFVMATLDWSVTKLWLYYLISASLTLVGVQLMIAWVQVKVLDALRVRDQLIAEDMRGKKQKSTDFAAERVFTTVNTTEMAQSQ